MLNYVKAAADWNRRICHGLVARHPRFFGSESYKEELDRRISETIRNENPRYVLEVGGIDRPLLAKSGGYIYHGLDIEEKTGCCSIYDDFIVQSIETPVADRAYDLIVSITVLEHIPDNENAVANIHSALKPGGMTHHYIPAKWHPYSIALRLVGPTWQRRLIRILRSSAVEVTGYPAFFHYCSVMQMKRLFHECGFVDIDVRPYWRANDYFAFFIPAFIAITAFENMCSRFRWTIFSSGFVISGRRP